MPTGGSEEGLGETVADVTPEPTAGAVLEATSAPVAATAVPPLPSPIPSSAPAAPVSPLNAGRHDAGRSPPPPVWEPRRRQAEPGHAARNVFLAILVLALVGVALFGIYRQHGGNLFSSASPSPSSAAATSPAVAPSTEPTPEPLPPPPPPEAAPAAPVQPDPEDKPAEAAPETKSDLAKLTPLSETKPQRGSPVPADTAFQLTATPAGAAAIFDKNAALKCVTPCSMTLPAGRHTFVVQFAGYRDAQRIIDIPHDTGLIVNLERMSGMLTLSTDPSGLTIVIDGQEQARKSPATFMLPPGPHKLEIVKGTERHALSVEIHDGSTIERNVDLRNKQGLNRRRGQLAAAAIDGCAAGAPGCRWK